MLGSPQVRRAVAVVFEPAARGLLRIGLSPDVVTVAGLIGLCVGALGFYPRGQLFAGTMIIVAFVLSDALDGTMARLSGRSSRWGAFLDSTLDRLGDAAIFGGLAWWFTAGGAQPWVAGLSLFCLVMGFETSYARARAEGLGFSATVGIAERSERLIVILMAAGFTGLGVPFLLPVLLWLLAVASTVTVLQRILAVRGQALAAEDVSATRLEQRVEDRRRARPHNVDGTVPVRASRRVARQRRQGRSSGRAPGRRGGRR